MGVNPRISGSVGGDYLVEKTGSTVAVGGARREKGFSEVAVAGEHTLADTRISLPRLSLNSKNVGKEKKCDAGRYGWSGRGLVVEVDVTGRRRVFWESRKGGVSKGSDSREDAWGCVSDTSKSLKWVPKGIATETGLGFGTSPVMIDPLKCPFFPVSSGPCLSEVGEGPSHGKGGSAQAQARLFEMIGASARCAMPLVEADALVLVGVSSGEPTATSGEADDHSGAGASSDELAVASGEAEGSSSANLSSDKVAGKADGPPDVGISSDELAAPQVESDDRLSTDTSSGESERLFSRPSGECALYDLNLSLSRTGFVALGDKEGNEGGLDSCLPTDAFVFEQPRLAELPMKALCAVPGVSNYMEEDFNLSNSGLGEEESSPIPLMSITPFGLSLSAENCGTEAVGCESILDTSKWVKNRLPSFSKLVGLSLNRHEKLCIDLLQRIEKEMMDAKAMNKKDTPTRKVVIFKDKGKRELRNLLSSVNYDGRKCVGC